jgi:hypothetical protein
MSKIWTFMAAVCVTLTGLVAGSAPARAGVDVVVYERYERYQRITVTTHHGYRPYRPGYVYHRGHWFSAASMRAGVIVDRPILPHRILRPVGFHPRHYSWCADRYRSYNWRSNTFQPYHGPRQQCYSPYF